MGCRQGIGERHRHGRNLLPRRAETDLFGDRPSCAAAPRLVIQELAYPGQAGYQPESLISECLRAETRGPVLQAAYQRCHFISGNGQVGRCRQRSARHHRQTNAREDRAGRDPERPVHAANGSPRTGRSKPKYEALLTEDRASQIEQVSARLRDRMAWLQTANRPPP